MIFWRKLVVHPFLWSRHDFISPRCPFEQVLKSSGFRLNIWNWLCCSSRFHVMISDSWANLQCPRNWKLVNDTSNALCKMHLQKNYAFTVAPTTVWHNCFSRMSVREMPKLYILTYCLYFVYRVKRVFFSIVGAWVTGIGCLTSHSTIFQLWDGTYIDVQAVQRRRSWAYGQVPTQ